MTEVPESAIRKLQEMTGASYEVCRKALIEAGGI